MSLPALYGDVRRWALLEADALALLPQLPAHSVDAVVTDPPYGLGFTGAAWDGRDIRGLISPELPVAASSWAFERFSTAWAAEVLRVLRPGGHMVAFGAPRTVHRLVSGLEEAGLEVRDQLLWLYGEGMPKSRKLPGGRGTNLKPAYEPIVLARAPLVSTVRETIDGHGTGALEIDAGRVPDPRAPQLPSRWPANVVLSHEFGCTDARCQSDCVTAVLDEATPQASRFFYVAKASRAEREAGCEGLPVVETTIFSGREPQKKRNPHPTVKPIELMRWLVRLTCQPDGVVLDPFTGSGSTGAAALLEDRRFVGIEQEPSYVAVARARLVQWSRVGRRD